MRNRIYRREEFGPEDEVRTVKVDAGGPNGKVAVYGRLTGAAGAATLEVYGAFTSSPTNNEVQTLNLGDISTGDTFKLTFSAAETAAAVTYSTDMSTDITTILESLASIDPGDVVVVKVSLTVYTVTFQGQYANQDAGAITITSPVGFTPTGVTETAKGGSASEALTDTATLGDPISLVAVDIENKFPYLVLVFGGDADPDLAAEAYVVAF